MNNFVIAIATVLVIAVSALADNSFEGKQGIVDRSAYGLYGGHVEDMTVDTAGHIYAGLNSPNGVVCTSDSGATWSQPAAGVDLGNVHAIAVKPDGSAIFIIAGIGLFRSNDGCVNWTKLSAIDADYAFEVRYAHSTLLAANKNGTIDRSTDDGATLTRIVVADGVTGVKQIAPSPTAGEFYLLATLSGSEFVFHSTDGGANWVQTSKSGSYSHIAVDPNDSQHVLIGNDSGGVEQSTDGGSTWNTLNINPSPANTSFSFAGNKLFVSTTYTTDNGATWHNIAQEATSPSQLTGHFVADPNNSDVVFASSQLGIARSADSGANWSNVVNGLYGVTIHAIAQTNNKNTVYLATEQGLAKTTNFLDSTPTWSFPVDLGAGIPSSGVYSVHLDQTTPSTLYLGLGGAIIVRSTDSGATWTNVSNQNIGNLNDIVQTTDGTLYAAYGTTSSTSHGGVLKSSDGVTWTNIANGIFDGEVNTLTTVDNNVFAGLGNDQGTNSAGQLGVWKYDGSTWAQIPGTIASKAVWDLLSIGNVILAATVPTVSHTVGATGTIMRSSDGGNTWAEVNTSSLKTDNGFYRTLAVDPQDTNVIYAAQGNPSGIATIYQSGDMGQTWNLVYTGLTDEVPSAMMVDGLLSGFNTGLFGFSRDHASLSLKYDARKKQILCTLKSGKAAISNQYVNLTKKSLKKRKAPYKLSGRKITSSKGISTFPAKNIKASAVRCEWTNLRSKAKNF